MNPSFQNLFPMTHTAHLHLLYPSLLSLCFTEFKIFIHFFITLDTLLSNVYLTLLVLLSMLHLFFNDTAFKFAFLWFSTLVQICISMYSNS